MKNVIDKSYYNIFKMSQGFSIDIKKEICLMLSPRESVLELKLWRVNRSFHVVMKEVIALQLGEAQAFIDEYDNPQPGKTQGFDVTVPSYNKIKSFILIKEDITVLKQMNAPPTS